MVMFVASTEQDTLSTVCSKKGALINFLAVLMLCNTERKVASILQELLQFFFKEK